MSPRACLAPWAAKHERTDARSARWPNEALDSARLVVVLLTASKELDMTVVWWDWAWLIPVVAFLLLGLLRRR